MPDPDRGPLQGVPKYNPHLWSDKELRAIFVVRNRELNGLLERLRQTPPNSAPQHVLMVGQRGMGKTTLLCRVALAVRDDAELASRWIALTFPEEQFTVSTLAELWSNVLDALTDALENEGAPPAELHRLDSEIQRLQTLPPPEREAAAVGLLDAWIAEHQRRILLLIDSTDLLFTSLRGAEESKRGSKTDADALWRLRKTLTHHSGFFWLGASYHTLESSHRYSDAFHDFFELLELRPLSLSEMREAMLALARTFGAAQEAPGDAAAQAMARILDANPERLKALRNLSGGNPRTTVILYELFAADRQDNLHADLKLLLDLMTPLYKARMENLADQPRKLLAHIMEHWSPIALAELSEASGIPSSTISGQLNRLEVEGFIEKVKLPGRRRAGYQVAERFFNIWYLMRYSSRRDRQKLNFLIEFMRLWYAEKFDLEDFQIWHNLGHILEHQLDLYEESESAYRKAIELNPKSFLSWESLGILLANKLGRPKEAEAAYQRAIELNSNDPNALYNLANLLTIHLGRYSEAEAAYRKAIELDPKDAWSWINLANLLTLYQGRHTEAEAAYRKAIELDPKDAWSWINLANLLTLYQSRHTEAEAAYRKAIELDPKDATLWYNMGAFLQYQLGRYEEAEAAYHTAIQINPKSIYPVANRANLLAFLNRCDQASEAYQQVLALAGPLVKSQAANYWQLLLQAHLWLGNQDSARQALDSLANLATSSDQYTLHKLRGQAYECHRIGLGLALAELMEQSTHASFLKPIALALRAASGQADALDGIPPEMRSMAEEVLQSIL